MYCIYTCALRIVTIGGLRRSHTTSRQSSLYYSSSAVSSNFSLLLLFLTFFYSFSSLAYLFLRHFSSLSLSLAFFFHNILSKRRATWSTARRTITPVTKQNWKHEREHCGIYTHNNVYRHHKFAVSSSYLLSFSSLVRYKNWSIKTGK